MTQINAPKRCVWTFAYSEKVCSGNQPLAFPTKKVFFVKQESFEEREN